MPDWEKRESNRNSSQEILALACVEHEIKNGGAHLIVKHEKFVYDFWPGTGLFIRRTLKGEKPHEGRGVFNLLKSFGISRRQIKNQRSLENS